MPELVKRAAVGSPAASGGYQSGGPPGFTFDDARQNLRQNLFNKCGKSKPHWKTVLYGARHEASIVGSQIQLLANVRALIPVVVEFETSPDKWVRAAEHRADDPQIATAIAIATRTWSMFRSESGSRTVPVRTAAEVMSSTGEGYGVEYLGANGKPAAAIVHTPAINVKKDGTAEWFRRASGRPVKLARGQFQRLWVEDETFMDDCTSEFRGIADDLACLEIVNAALRAGGRADLVSRGLIWAPTNGPNDSAGWIDEYEEVIQAVLRDPMALGGLVPFPVEGGVQKPEYVSLGNIQDNLVKMHELYVDVIARGSPLPAKLVKDGPGEGNAYADHVLNRLFLQYSASPLMNNYVYPDIACWWWHPKLDANPQFINTGVESCRFRLAGDVNAVANRPDSRKEALEGFKCGLFTPSFVAQQFGASEDEILRPGTPEYDDWLQTVALIGNSPGRPETSPDNDQRSADGFTTGNPLGPRLGALERVEPQQVHAEVVAPLELERIW